MSGNVPESRVRVKRVELKYRDMLMPYSSDELRDLSENIEAILDERFFARRRNGR